MSRNTINTIGSNIKKLRRKQSISQEELAKLSKVTVHTIVKIETGATLDPRVQTLMKIAAALKVNVNLLIN